jgi:transposase-like protein
LADDEQFELDEQRVAKNPEVRRRRRSAQKKRDIAEMSLQPGAFVREAEIYDVQPSEVRK